MSTFIPYHRSPHIRKDSIVKCVSDLNQSPVSQHPRCSKASNFIGYCLQIAFTRLELFGVGSALSPALIILSISSNQQRKISKYNYITVNIGQGMLLLHVKHYCATSLRRTFVLKKKTF
jgi:hypothetical protein